MPGDPNTRRTKWNKKLWEIDLKKYCLVGVTIVLMLTLFCVRGSLCYQPDGVQFNKKQAINNSKEQPVGTIHHVLILTGHTQYIWVSEIKWECDYIPLKKSLKNTNSFMWCGSLKLFLFHWVCIVSLQLIIIWYSTIFYEPMAKHIWHVDISIVDIDAALSYLWYQYQYQNYY